MIRDRIDWELSASHGISATRAARDLFRLADLDFDGGHGNCALTAGVGRSLQRSRTPFISC